MKKNWPQKCKKGKRKGTYEWPKFRSWSAEWFSLFYDEPKKGFHVDVDVLHLSLGQDESSKRLFLEFHLKEAHRLKGQSIRNMRIVRENGTYFAIFTVDVTLPETKPVHRVIAIDPNHKNFGYGVDTSRTGIEIAAPTWLKTYDKRIDELKGKRDRCQKKAKKVAVKASDGTPTGKEYFVSSRRWEKRQKTLGSRVGRVALPQPAPLGTVRDSFPSYGSSPSKVACGRPAIFRHSLLEFPFLKVALEVRIIGVSLSSDFHVSYDTCRGSRF